MSLRIIEHELKVVDEADPEVLFHDLLEFQSKIIVLSCKIVNMHYKKIVEYR